MFESTLVGQTTVVDLLNRVLDNPPHIFLSGSYGSGKTTLLHEFIAAYFNGKKVQPNHESILWLSSEQDRGIHCVRQSVAEFVRHTSSTPGVYRWIVVDDADSLPIISQQALRRPMETHSHSTRFIFCSRYSSDLIQPLKSRCMNVEMKTISPIVLIDYFFKLYGASHLKISLETLPIFISIVETPTQIRNCIRILSHLYRKRGDYVIEKDDILSLFSAPSFSLCYDLLKYFIFKNNEKMIQIFIELWKTGISYEDFLHELNSSLEMMEFIPASSAQEINELLIRGWINFAQGKTHTLDMMRLFLEKGW
jgi:DNA polymerase III delta prime subunit